MEFLQSTEPAEPTLAEMWANLSGSLEGTSHRRVRVLTRRALSRPTALDSRWLIDLATATLERNVLSVDGADLLHDFVYPFVTQALSRLVFGDVGQDVRIRRWSDALNRCLFRPSAQNLGVAEQIARDLRECIEQEVPDVDCIMTRARARDSTGDRMTPPEQSALIGNVAFGGIDTTAKAIGNGLFTVLRLNLGPLVREASAVVDRRAMVEELLRLEPPVAGVTRTVDKCEQVEGVELPPGSVVMGVGLLANRDPDVFARPHEFLADRGECPHTTFGGSSPHHCVGKEIARDLYLVALSAVVDAAPNVALATLPERVPWHAGGTFRGILALPVRCA